MKPLLSKKRKLISGAGLALMIAMACMLSVPKAQAVEGCSTENWYNCAQKRSEIERLISGWCSFAESSKRSECTLTILGTAIETDPARLAREGIGGVPAYCRINAQATDEQKRQIPNCYTLIKHDSDWYAAVVALESACGVSPNQDANCVAKAKKEFLYDQGWAKEPDETTTKSVDGGDPSMPASQTPFMLRVATYLRWIFVGVGVLAVFGFIISAIQYGAAQDNPQSVAAAKTRIINIIYGVVIFATMFGLLQWLVPGGLF